MRISRFLIVFLAALACQSASAAPFCALYGWGRQCLYPDLDSCLNSVDEAVECVVNEDEIKLPFGDAKYCVVSPYAATQCLYDNEDDCRMAAKANGALCMMKID